MKTNNDQWERLARAARPQFRVAPGGAPFGFATRVVARWRSEGSMPESPWELLSLKSLAFAVVIMLVSVGFSYESLADQLAGDPMDPPTLVSLLSVE